MRSRSITASGSLAAASAASEGRARIVRADTGADAVADLDRLAGRALGLDVSSEDQRDARVLGQHAHPERRRRVGRDQPQRLVGVVEGLLVDLFAEGRPNEGEQQHGRAARPARRPAARRARAGPAAGRATEWPAASAASTVDTTSSDRSASAVGRTRRQFERDLVVLQRLLRRGDAHRLVAGAHAREVGGVEIVRGARVAGQFGGAACRRVPRARRA